MKKNTMKMILKSSALARSRKSIEGINPNPDLYTSNQCNVRPQRPHYVFEDITNVTQAVSLFHQMLEMRPMPPIHDYNKLLNIVVRMKKYSKVIVMFKTLLLLDYPVNEFIMATVINCYCYLKEMKMGFATVAAFLKRGYAPDVVCVSCLLKGILLEAKAVSNGPRGNRMVDDAMSLLSEMIEIGISPDVATYNMLIHGLCSFKRWEEADRLLRQMVDSKICPSLITFNTLVDTYCKEGLIKNAEQVVQIMTEGGKDPDVVTYSALMNGYCLQGRLDKAKELLNLMEEKGPEPNLVSYCTMINGYCKHENINDAWEMFKEMPLKGFKPNTFGYNCMIQGLLSVGRCSQALELFNEMKVFGPGCSVYTYGIVLDGLFNNGKIEEATLLYHEVDSKGLAAGHVDFYNAFIHCLCCNNHLDLARSIFDNLSSKGLYPNVITYNVMMKGLCQKGMIHEVKALLDKMERSGCVPNKITYNTIIHGCLKHYDSFGGCDILRRVAEKDFSFDASTFSVLLQQMQVSDEDILRKSLIQKLISMDTRSLIA